ncbi:hypothetical protein A3B05_03570 [Candidatus Giovannonibacteria bacterium RIFCSPLOWO2_01_FULL_43_160]|uniref:Addiction module toxin, RelE/StbE family n=3 Tax=Parcubacteria group TaxID=1794811 RepID=A0A0G1IW11_9BACT|nr:MAG: hypothetical protein UU83_C0039G0001 [Candidatus Jorgensenbacteria bacterium GW2011_GWF2_41_8]KKS96391.1 MAG: hypothetical protein UV72_C0003G0012 [Candidatus Giovannonibacteria bacterium GW2011_GWB1_43_13]KKS99255.1 MAG: hypothetical protein UV75_C0007G0012 [Candidatus Giovannonibacteria bacterium GW2011_GWA1_43_15]KKT20978.1 MAG: hypothetical protein UW05_C0021G0003 [Candidatus Giovannonibacteria bacterium GW2011_GWC2_43_8]KKT63138.1 MAG: hypothetical protein UW55_C0006G0007 [Candidat
MRVIYDQKFLKELEKTPSEVQNKADALLEPLKDEPFHPLLHTKKLKGPLYGLYSFRVLEYRVIFEVEKPDVVRLLAIRHRKDVYKYKR